MYLLLIRTFIIPSENMKTNEYLTTIKHQFNLNMIPQNDEKNQVEKKTSDSGLKVGEVNNEKKDLGKATEKSENDTKKFGIWKI